MTVPSADDFAAGFSTSIDKCQGTPTYATINAARTALKANAAAIPTTLGGGNHGHLGMIIDDNAYAAIPNTQPYVIPAFPGGTPTFPDGSTSAQRADATNDHKHDLHNFRECMSLQQALRKQLIDSIDYVYLEGLRNSNTGFAHVSVRQMLTFLLTNYGKITRRDLAQNLTVLAEPYDVDVPMETLFSKLQDCFDYATDGQQPIAEHQLVSAAYTAIYNTGFFFDACDDWDDEANQSWAAFKTFFLAQQIKQRNRRTTRQDGFNAANLMLQEQIAQLATNAECDRHQAAAVQADQRQVLQSLTDNIATLNRTIKEKDSTIAKLKDNKTPPGERKKPTDHGSYCWTHGYCVHKDHNGTTCKFPKEGHMKEATKANTMGGSIRYKEHTTST